MSSDLDKLRQVLDRLDNKPPALEFADALASATEIAESDAYDRVTQAIDEGILVEKGDGLGYVQLTEEFRADNTSGRANTNESDTEKGNISTTNPISNTQERAKGAAVERWRDVDFSAIDAETWAPAQIDTDAWMCRKETKAPYAPWADADAPVECSHGTHDEATTCDECTHHAGYKWGSDGSREHVHGGYETAREWADMDPSLSSDLAFIQQEADPFAFVDGDDVRDPETGEIHPVFEAILEHLGVTYADVSTSGGGVHAVYRGEIPLNGVPEAKFEIDTEPWGENDEVPAVEIYDGKHVCIATGDHLAGTGTQVVKWNDDALGDILRANGYKDRPEPSAETSVALEDYEPTATDSDETTDDIRDIFCALNRLDPKRVGERTIVTEWTRGRRSFLPTWGSPIDNGTANYIDDRIWHDTGHAGGYGGPAVMAAIDAGLISHHGANPSDVSGKTFFKALDHLRELGFSIPRLESGADRSAEEYRTDPRHIDATVDPRRAWDAAGRVTPDEADGDLPTTNNGEAFASPSGEAVDVVRAVAIAEAFVDTAEEPLKDEYPDAYRLAREQYDAPLPKYYTTADAIAEFDAVLDLIGEVTFFHLNDDALESEITEEGDQVGGQAVRALNPSWRESKSEASVFVFPSGIVWDADTERRIDAQRFVALDSGIIDEPGDAVTGSDFTEAYRRLRDEYGAPLPRWDPATNSGRDITPQLPPSEELLAEVDLDGVDTDALDSARDEVEALIREATTDAGSPTVVTALPATGKTTGTVKTARDRPLSYLAPRKELQDQALRKAERWGVDAEILPVFSEERVREDVLGGAVSYVRENGKSRLRNRWSVLSAAFDDIDKEDDDTPEPGDIFIEGEGEEINLERPTCETAEGKHGVDWALAVHVARQLGYTPKEIHTQAGGLFGDDLPCSREEHDCEYTQGWDVVGDADDSPDLLVGSYVHAHVESVRTNYDRGPRGEREKHTRPVVLDEFVGEAFTREFGSEALDFATWLATCLRDDVADRRDMIDTDLYGDEWIQSWLDGEAEEHSAIEDLLETLARTGELYDARDEADAILGEIKADTLDELGLRQPLAELVDGSDDPAAAYRDLRAAIGGVDPNHPRRGVARWADEEVAESLEKATVEGQSTPSLDAIDTDAVPFGGDLEAIVSLAVEAGRNGGDTAREAISAAVTALRGGREGCRRLAAWADDGYAHPDAHHLLRGVITPTDEDSDDPGARRIHTDNWSFDSDITDGTVLDVVETTEKARTVVDRNDHGALLHTPPSRKAGNGDEVPLVGLDATGRKALWTNALGEDVAVADIHDTSADRADFLLEALDLRVIQAADRPRFYEGDPTTKDTDGDAALLEAIADEYAGIDAPRQRGEAAETVGKPAAITTKGVRGILEDDQRLDDVVTAWENYGNVTGANYLGEHRLAAVLGCQHYGDQAIERFCAIGGREIDTSRDGGRGAALEYEDEVADAYLKHMTEDQTMQAILRFARGDSGATVVARTSALREDLPVAGDAQVVETWSDTATTIAREYRRLGKGFTAADVRDAVNVGPRQVRRVLSELVDAGYINRVDSGDGIASTYEPVDEPGSGEVELPDRGDVVDAVAIPGQNSTNDYYTWNVRVSGGRSRYDEARRPFQASSARAPPAPSAIDGVEPPG